MSARQRSARRAVTAQRRSAWSPALIAGVIVAGVVIVGAWLLLRPSTAGQRATGSGGLPGPLGGSSVATDVNTLVGKPAPAFTLADSDGKSYAITPGQGRPIVLISHMGIT